MYSFFFRKLQLITVLLLIRDSYMSWGTRFVSLKLYERFSFSIVSRIFKFSILFKKHGLFDLKRHKFRTRVWRNAPLSQLDFYWQEIT